MPAGGVGSARPMSSSRFSISSGLSFQRKFFSARVILPFSIRNVPSRVRPGVQHRARVERADVEEVRDEDAALAAGDQLLGRLRAAGQRRAAAGTTRREFRPVGCAPCFCAQKRVYARFLSMPFSIHTVRRIGSPSPSNGCAEQLRVGRIGVERHALVGRPSRRSACRRPASRTALRPSSALRALSAPASSGTRSATACGSSTTVYSPGSIACGLRLATRLSAPRRGRAPPGRRRPSRARRRSPSRSRCRPACARSSRSRRRSCGGRRTGRCSLATATARAFASRKPAMKISPAGLPAAAAASIARRTASRALRGRGRRCARRRR